MNTHEAKTNLSRLVEAAVKVTQFERAAPRRVGFQDGAYSVPADLDRMEEDMIRAMFESQA